MAGHNRKVPLLVPRLNRSVPRAFGTLRLAILAVVMLFVLDVIGMTDVRAWMESRLGLQVTTSIVSVAIILLVAFLLWLALTSFVDFRLDLEHGAVPTLRETTLLTLLRNAVTIALVILTLMFCLSEIGLDIGPLLASAGVLGLAIGFSAQSMVKDIIAGTFIQFENAINVGEVITVGGNTRTVEKLSVRSVGSRDAHAVFHIIPFPQQTIWLGEAKDGSTQRFRIEDVSQASDAASQSGSGQGIKRDTSAPKDHDPEGSREDNVDGETWNHRINHFPRTRRCVVRNPRA